MLHRTFRRRFVSPASAETTWRYLSDPAAIAAASSHPTVAALEGPLQVGATWSEYHIDDGCDFDSVFWRCTAYEPGRLTTVEGRQAGMLQRATNVLRTDGDLVEVESILLVRLAMRAPGSLLERAMSPLLLVLPLGVRMVREGFDEAVDDDVRALTALAS